jgi:hypothetical protein
LKWLLIDGKIKIMDGPEQLVQQHLLQFHDVKTPRHLPSVGYNGTTLPGSPKSTFDRLLQIIHSLEAGNKVALGFDL